MVRPGGHRPPERGATGRTRGRPPSANGASSCHLWWRLPGGDVPLVKVGVTVEVLHAPVTDRLCFWALQVSFAGGGAAHLGLQWHPGFRERRAVNWGGYDAAGRELPPSPSPLPSDTGNPNTRTYRWEVGRRYRLTIGPGPQPGTWRGSVAGPADPVVVVRDLPAGPAATSLLRPVVWTESFLDCDHPGVAARWSDPWAETVDGRRWVPTALVVGYQSVTDGGCTNTTVEVDGAGVVQRTNAPRTVPAGAVLPWPPPAAAPRP